MLGKVFKAYDIRGTYPDPLNESMAWKIGYGCGRYLIEEAESSGETSPMARNIVVGRDMRKHSPGLRDALIRGMGDAGAGVIDVGMVDTPFLYFAINRLDCAGGVQVTASHNPPNYNGFKVSRRHAKPVGESTGLAQIREYAALANEEKTERRAGTVEQRDLWDAYREHVLSYLDLRGKTLRVAIDASNGMAGTMVPKLFDGVEGLEIETLYFDNSTGEFVHEPNPLVPSNLIDLQQKVTDTGADFGICFDGDADRLIVIDETGGIVGCDHLTAMLAPHFLKENPGSAVVYDLRSSNALKESIEKSGGTPIRSKVGHVHMKAALAEHGGSFGGELSGHFYFADNFNADSGAIAMASVLTVIAETGTPVSELIAPLARYAQSGERNFEVEDKDMALEEIRETYEGRGEIDTLDGVTVDCFENEGWWCNIRKSNTEPLLRLNMEAKDEPTLEKMLGEVTPMLGEPVAH